MTRRLLTLMAAAAISVAALTSIASAEPLLKPSDAFPGRIACNLKTLFIVFTPRYGINPELTVLTRVPSPPSHTNVQTGNPENTTQPGNTTQTPSTWNPNTWVALEYLPQTPNYFKYAIVSNCHSKKVRSMHPVGVNLTRHADRGETTLTCRLQNPVEFQQLFVQGKSVFYLASGHTIKSFMRMTWDQKPQLDWDPTVCHRITFPW